MAETLTINPCISRKQQFVKPSSLNLSSHNGFVNSLSRNSCFLELVRGNSKNWDVGNELWIKMKYLGTNFLSAQIFSMLLLTYIADAGKKEKCDFCKSIEKNFIEVSPGVLWLSHFLYSVGSHPVSSLHIQVGSKADRAISRSSYMSQSRHTSMSRSGYFDTYLPLFLIQVICA